MAEAILGVSAPSCGIPSPSHQGFFCSCEKALHGANAGASAAVLSRPTKLRRDITDLVMELLRQMSWNHGYGSFHKRIRAVQGTRPAEGLPLRPSETRRTALTLQRRSKMGPQIWPARNAPKCRMEMDSA